MASKAGASKAGQQTFGSACALRRAVRAGLMRSDTAGKAPGYLQGNLAILPKAFAPDFLLFCQKNQKPCPIIGIGEAGSPALPDLGDDIDIRVDVPRYRVFRGGADFESVEDLNEVWREDLVTFVLGCSFSFEEALASAGIPVRHIDAGRNAPMYLTSIDTVPAGPFKGPLVVSMRAFKPSDAIQAILLSARQRLAHGAPVHIGDPAQIGIADIMRPDFGDTPVMEEGDIPVFWACGVTPQIAIRTCGADLAITHEPGHMLVTDIPAEAAENRLSGIGAALAINR
ncbi:putative hydro-lyase [Chelativorans xinjiangense]|uniref:putative hydro-lyase n=1 Tax=Chelativorans xinjiangense TaxID=2681485 RepID=UPI0013586D8F|nr:putative hydro-lyase [Chelativorans xinjiangense]